MKGDLQFLRGILLSNGVFSGLSGVILIVLPGTIGNLLGYRLPMLYVGLGVGLLTYAGQLYYQFRKPIPSRPWVLWFILADVLWVIGSGIVLVSGRYVTTATGEALVILVALIVGVFAGLQYRGLPSIGRTQQ